MITRPCIVIYCRVFETHRQFNSVFTALISKHWLKFKSFSFLSKQISNTLTLTVKSDA